MIRLPSALTRSLVIIAACLPLSRVAAQNDRTGALYRDSYTLEGKKDYVAALARVREARTAGGSAYFAALRSGWLQYMQGDFAASVASYTEAVASEPKAVEPKLGLTLPLMAQRNWRELERACTAVLAIDPHNATALSRLGVAQYNAGNFSGAEATYRRLTDDYPSDTDYKTGLGWALQRQGKKGEARPWFEAVLSVSPDNANAKAGLAAK